MTVVNFPHTERTATEAALAEIRKQFSAASIYRNRKEHIRRVIKMGTGHPFVRARYGGRLAMLRGRSLDAAIFITEQDYQDERCLVELANRGAELWGGPHRPRMALYILAELRLMLRFLRRSEYATHWQAILSFMGDEVFFVADNGKLEAVIEDRL